MNDPKAESTNKKKSVYTANFEGLVDLVEHEGNVAFLTVEGQELCVKFQMRKEGKVLVPPGKSQCPFLLPNATNILQHFAKSSKQSMKALYDDLKQYHKEASELPSDEHYDLLAAWDIHTYLLEYIGKYSPYIYLFSSIGEMGKTRTGESLIYLAYRGYPTESLNQAYLLRHADYFRGSLFIDVMSLWSKAARNDSVDILLKRYEKGAKVARVLNLEKPAFQDMRYFNLFGPTVIATNEPVHPLLESRSLEIRMHEADRSFENDVMDKVALPLKERLVAFRGCFLATGKKLPECQLPTKGRLGTLLRPFLRVIRFVNPEREDVFLKLVHHFEERRREEAADSLEAQILRTVIALREKVRNADYLAVSHITVTFNRNSMYEREKLSPESIGRKLKALGFEKRRIGKGTEICWNEKLVRKLASRYGIDGFREPAQPTYPTPSRREEGEGSEGSVGFQGQ